MLVLVAVLLALVAPSAADVPATVPNLNVTQYVGTWYNVYADLAVFAKLLPFGGYCVTATYGAIPDVPLNVTVFNSAREWNVTGTPKTVTGYASAANASEMSQLSVYFHGRSFGAPYWVVAVGPVFNEQYEYAIVSDPYRLFMWVLVRNVARFNEQYDAEVIALLPTLGFEGLNGPIKIVQEGCTYE